MSDIKKALHGIQYSESTGWEVWSHMLQFPVCCGSPADAKRIARALETYFPRGGPVDYSIVDTALEQQPSQLQSAN